MQEALRFLVRSPRFALPCALIVALGVAMSTLLMAVVKATLIDPWPYDGAERIVTIRASYPELGRERFPLWSAPEVLDLSQQREVFDAVIAGVAEPLTFDAGTGMVERVRAASITPNAFAMLGVPARLGRVLRNDDASPAAGAVAVVSDAFWRERLGADPAIVGRVLRVGARQVTIVGVMPPAFRWWDREIWLPLRLDATTSRTDRRYYVQGRLRPGVTPATAERELHAFSDRMRTEHPETETYAHLTISLRTLLDEVLRDLRPALQVLLVAVLLVMLTAAANLSSIVLGRATSREGEFAVRLALGATRARVTGQLLAENLVLAAIGAALGVAAAILLLPSMLALVPYGFIPAEAHVSIDWRVAAASAAVSLVMCTLSALVPAWRAAGLPITVALRRNDLRTGTGRVTRTRGAFVVGQLAAAIALLTAGLAAVWTLTRSIAHDPGFEPGGVWTAQLSEGDPAVVERIVDAVRVRTGDSVAAISALPVGELPTALISIPSQAARNGRMTAEADIVGATDGAEGTYGFRIREGRAFRKSDGAGSERVAIVTNTLSRRLWPTGAVGRELRLDVAGAERTAVIVGVMDDIDSRGDRHPRPLTIVPLAQLRPADGVAFGGRGPAREGLAALRAAIREVDPQIAISQIEPLEQVRRDALGPRIFAVVMLSAFCMAVVVLSIVGLHTLIAEIARERRRETAIRLALGARPAALVAVELRRTAVLVAAAVVVAAPAFAATPALLGAVFDGIGMALQAAAVVSVLCLSGASLLAAGVPAWNVARGEKLIQRIVTRES